MLYPYATITEEPLDAPWQGAEDEPISLWAELICGIDSLLNVPHELLYAKGGQSLTILWRDAVYLWSTLSEPFGSAIAAISKRWPLALYGTSEARETITVTVVEGKHGSAARLSSVSGKRFDHLQGLGLQLEAGDPETAKHLATLSGALGTRADCAALPRREEEFLNGCSLLNNTPGSLFLYLSLREAQDTSACLHCLSVPQKAELWQTFLQDQLQPVEFDWLWASYADGDAPALLEWELALRAVLTDLHFVVERQERRFTVTDSTGTQRWFDFLKGGPADKLFLKLLFPLTTR